jgi:hypothetical protein
MRQEAMMTEGMNWHPEARLMFRTDIFKAVLKAGAPGIKLTELHQTDWRKNYGTRTQLFQELKEMVAAGQLHCDDAVDNTYRTDLTIEAYCLSSGESRLNFLGVVDDETQVRWLEESIAESKKNVGKYCVRNEQHRCIQCRGWAPKKKRICPVYRAYQKYKPTKTHMK